MRVIDFFCGAGGFSEGFRQQGFQIIKGIDYWKPALDSHNLNHHLNDPTYDILNFWGESTSDTKEINKLPDCEVIIGSPSCVSFSMSNKAGKADKSEGIRLIESVLRVIAVKKHQKNSTLTSWFLENVPQSRPFIKEEYTFSDLNLSAWAKALNLSPLSTALCVKGQILNAADYGAPQSRSRLIVGEWLATGEFIRPTPSCLNHISSQDIRSKMPAPTLGEDNNEVMWTDPNYPNLIVPTSELTDHFYDSGLYKIEWEKAEHLKVNHPFMGKMSFPENEKRSCRTIMATRSAATREAIIYKSEHSRAGNGEYRLPTIREIASLMGYPYCYQFTGSEATKWKQIGNSVSPHLSSALAKAIRNKMGLPKLANIDFSDFVGFESEVANLNTFKIKEFNTPRQRMKNPKFRRHPIKAGNMTIDLMNYHAEKSLTNGKKWYVTAHSGTGKKHQSKTFNKKDMLYIELLLKENLDSFSQFKNSLLSFLPKTTSLQKSFEEDLNITCTSNPILQVKTIAKLIAQYKKDLLLVESNNLFPKEKVPLSQVMSAYALLQLIN